MTISNDGQLRGTSEMGGRLEGRLAEEPNEKGTYPITGTMTAADGQMLDFKGFAKDTEPGEARFIVLSAR